MIDDGIDDTIADSLSMTFFDCDDDVGQLWLFNFIPTPLILRNVPLNKWCPKYNQI